MPRLPPSPRITFNADGLIHGEDFGDSYFSREDGLAETQAVFLEGCGLPNFWAGKSNFVIGELGFGTGLNALAVWDLWKRQGPPSGILHFISVEGFLMGKDAAQQAHERWPQIESLSQKLISRWPTRAAGAQRISFCEDRFCLTLVIGPCEAALASMDFQADCWFLDGFAPAKNPDMWSEGVFAQIDRLSARNAKVATYSVAGHVRAKLSNIGYQVERVAGFGSKKQRLEGARVDNAIQPRANSPRTALVIGGGIAGAAMCRALTARAIATQILDNDTCGRTKASGNPVALLAPRLDRGDTHEAQFFRSAYLMACDMYRDMDADAFVQSGVVERGVDADSKRRLLSLLDDPPLPEDQISLSGDGQGLVHLKGGYLFPDLVLKTLKAEAFVHPVSANRVEYKQGQWCAIAADGATIASADICIVAAGPALEQFCNVGGTLRGRAGQLSLAAINGPMPDQPICGSAYGVPFGQRLAYGATFEAWPLDQPPPPVTQERHGHNIGILNALAPELASQVDVASSLGRGSVRVTTPDHLPLAGPAPGQPSGLYVLGGLGSRGFTTAFLCAEMIASQVCGEPPPVEIGVAQAVSPSRFIERAARRGGQRSLRPSRT